MTGYAGEAAPRGGLTARRSARAFRGLLAARLLGAVADGVMLPFVILWAHRDAGLGGAAAGALFLVQAAGEFTGGLAGGALADRIGHRRMLLISTTGMALGYGSLFLAHHAVLALGSFLAAGLFESAFHPTIAALVADLHDDEHLHHAYGLTRMAAGAGSVIGPILGAGAVAFSLSGVFAAAGVLLAGAVVAVFVAVPSDRMIGASDPAIGASDPAIGPSGRVIGASDRAIGASDPAIGPSDRVIDSSDPAIGRETAERNGGSAAGGDGDGGRDGD
ncbi:MFS transporter, partial [Streptomyces sp. 8L]|uniref:MFS transporter n=1 Tax=Streptomyces sp. 8L TaxID=2877242 RepID=UPI001CD3311C